MTRFSILGLGSFVLNYDITPFVWWLTSPILSMSAELWCLGLLLIFLGVSRFLSILLTVKRGPVSQGVLQFLDFVNIQSYLWVKYFFYLNNLLRGVRTSAVVYWLGPWLTGALTNTITTIGLGSVIREEAGHKYKGMGRSGGLWGHVFRSGGLGWLILS